MNFDQFITKWTGKHVDFDGIYPDQCFDLAHQYIYDVLGIKDTKIIAHPAAYQIYSDFNQNGIDSKYFDKIANTPTGVPQKGDIIVFGTAIGIYGHVSIFYSGNTTAFKSFDANWPVNTLPHLQDHNYTGVVGWLRFKPQQATPATELQACILARDTNWNMVVALFAEMGLNLDSNNKEQSKANGVQVIKAYKNDIQKLKDRITNAQKALNG